MEPGKEMKFGMKYWELQNENSQWKHWGRYEKIPQGIIWKIIMKLSDKKMKLAMKPVGSFMKFTLDILLQVMNEAQHFNEWET